MLPIIATPPQNLKIMTQCIVYDETTKESQTFYTLTAAKKWMRERIKKFYTSIIETKNACCSGALSEDEKALFNELYTTYHFDDLIRRSLDFVKSKSSLFEQYENDLLEQIREAYWNEPDL